jgi:mRNA interferase RelE/StbE
MLNLDLSREAADFVTKLAAKQARQVWNKIVTLMKDPRPTNSEELKGYPGCFRTTVGEFRIVYQFDKEILKAIVIDRRNDDEIYKRLKRLR